MRRRRGRGPRAVSARRLRDVVVARRARRRRAGARAGRAHVLDRVAVRAAGPAGPSGHGDRRPRRRVSALRRAVPRLPRAVRRHAGAPADAAAPVRELRAAARWPGRRRVRPGRRWASRCRDVNGEPPGRVARRALLRGDVGLPGGRSGRRSTRSRSSRDSRLAVGADGSGTRVAGAASAARERHRGAAIRSSCRSAARTC